MLVPPQRSSVLGTKDYEAVVESMTNVENTGSRESYTKFTDVDRFKIPRYVCENGNKRALNHFKNKFPGLKESTLRTFKKHQQEALKKARSQKRLPRKLSKQKKREVVTSWWT